MQPVKATIPTAASGPLPPWRKLLKRLKRWRADFLWRRQRKIAHRKALRREPTLFNAARNRPARQSSTRRDSENFAARKGTTGRIGGRGFFATKREPCPWWMVELEADWPIYAIHVHKRHQAKAKSTTCLRVSLSADQQQWETVYSGQYHFGDAAYPGPLVIRLLDARGARFVKIELPEGGELALNQVEVMVNTRHRLLLRASRRYGFIFENMAAIRTPRRMKPYTVQHAPAGFDGRINAFHLTRGHGRFGNNLLQIGTAVCLAQHLGIRRVYLMDLPMLQIAETTRFGDVTIFPEAELQRHEPSAVLCGSFFHREQLGDAMTDLGFDRILEATRAVGQPIFHRLAGSPSFPVTATDLVIHLRAGDIFAKPVPHLGYVQPPLAFYRLCVDFARAELGIDRVILVYEDEGNPCIQAVKAWLDEIGLPYLAHSRSLKEDMAVLLAASHCVFGHGTFGMAMALLSRHMKTVHFSWLETRLGDVCRAAGIRAIRVDDVASGYIRSGEWRNTPQQRQQMLDYPIENLRLRSN